MASQGTRATGRPGAPDRCTAAADNDAEAKSHLAAITQELKRLGWSQDHNLRIDARFAAGIADQYPLLAKELAALQPDVMLSESTPAAVALK